MSNTRLIYVSKETAEVSNDEEGSFVNNVDDGIVVKVGDEINVEQIAINSVGVGAEIIEIPKRIKNYDYKTNTMCLNCAMYIHHNLHPFTIMMPLYGMDTINTTTTDRTYGYMKNGGNFPPALPFANTKTKYKSSQSLMRKNTSNRFYLGSYIFQENAQPQKPIPNPLGAGNTDNAVPSIGVFEFFRTDLTFEVDTGYDNPANIANKITQDFHAGNATPQLFNLDDNGGGLEAFAYGNPIGGSYQSSDLGVWTENTCCYAVKSYPPAFGNTALYSPYQSTLAYQNPFYAYYGSRLLSDNVAIGGVGDKNNSWLNANNPNAGANPPVVAQNNQIYMLEDMDADTAGTGTRIEINTLMTTNLLYDYNNVKMLRDFIHSQKEFPIEATDTTEGLNTNAGVRSETYALISVGRVNDSASTYSALTALQCPLQANGDSKSNNVEACVFFDEERWSKAHFSANGANAGFKVAWDYETPFSETPYKPLELNQKLDCMIYPVYTGTFNGVPEYNCGILLNDRQINNIRLLGCNYAVVDLGFFKDTNPCVMVLGDQLKISKPSSGNPTIGDYVEVIQVGSPNMNMLFDDTRGRFALENMAWNNMIQNTPANGQNPSTPNPSAGQECITQGFDFGLTYGVQGDNQKVYSYKYALSGIGILDISVIDDNYNIVKIDYDDEDDIKAKFNNSLLDRLGFTYKQLTNRNGRPDAIFTQRCYETKKPVRGVSIFPSPLTTNLRFDTSLDMGLSNNENGLAMYDLFPSNGYVMNVSAVSDRIYGLNLPKKLENPFWLIKSDIIDGVDFNSEKTGGGKQNVVAVCNRAYLAGDFAFSFSTSYSFKATKEFVITGIKTSILNPDLTPADIDEATTIIYKIVSPSPFFQAQEQAELEAREKKK